MTPTRIALCLILALFIIAEVARPTHVPAKKSAHALIVHSQAVAGTGVSDSLDPNLLDDLPRIHPDAVGAILCTRGRDGSFRLFGRFDADGSAVFVVNDAARLGLEATIFGTATRPHDFHIEISPRELGTGRHRLHVALVSSDQRGFFLLSKTIALTVGGSAHAPDDCRTV